mgnify:FL=1|tara:strand:+ start:189 stop:611 length:423 start_codon:yes stop_codon:yes gene_type:complete
MSTLTVYRNPRRRYTGNWLDSFFNDVTFPRLGFTDFFGDETHPTTRVAELEGHYDITLVAPGLDKKDFNVSLEGKTLTVSFEANGENTGAVNYSSFSKSWTVPDGTTEKHVHASYKSGVLTLNIQKSDPAKPTVKSIPVK